MNKSTATFIFCLCLFCLACSGSQNSPKTITITIEISHLPNSSTFQAKYNLSQPVYGLQFDRTTEGWKYKELRPTNPNLEIKTVNDHERILSKDQTAFSEFTLEFTTTSKDVEDMRDYKILDQYSDGSFLLYTGHFRFSQVVNQDQSLEMSVLVHNIYTFVPNPSEIVYLDGQRYNKKTGPWSKDKDHETFVFFGQPTTVETNSYVVLYDKSLPEWLRKQAEETMPSILKSYQKLFGISLSVRPTIFFYIFPSDSEGLSSSGGTLDNQINLYIDGREWESPSGKGIEHIQRKIAHEAAHLWNGHYLYYEEDTAWMHEGSATILASELSQNLGFIDHKRFAENMTENLNQCILNLNSGNINQSQNPYDCGAIIGLITGAAEKKADPKSNGIFDFWKDLFSLATKNNNTYTQEMYFALLLEKTHDDELVDGLKRLALETVAKPDDLLASLLTQAGVQITPKTNEYSQNQLRTLAGKTIRQIMDCDCGFLDIWGKNDHYAIGGHRECKTFKEDVNTDKLGGFSILNDTLKAYDYAYSQSQQNKPIQLDVYQSDQKIEVTCLGIVERPTLYQIH